ncbi:amidohydrolase family protein [Dyella sp.]|jgi:predicted TIM-barrel fold metal-dependent hydrolase|uniref:amidohydrolase family protein n=1 Tax=Dyella sp. TaxID=1869338 RepID=UPI002D793433|nr:amidohydrolase family protein [Dyella sp.]HET6431761.1 amidohydrolase family protein [Dyella sp.]
MRITCAVFLLALAVAPPGNGAPINTGQPSARAELLVDHHTHLNAPAIQAFVPTFCEQISRYGRCDAALTTPYTPDDLLHAMDKAGVSRALVLSTGYLPESPMMDPPPANATGLMHSANAWTVGLVRAHPDRFRAFIAVDPLRPDALPELAYWRGNAAVSGVKLHLTSSGVDLRNDAHLAALARVFKAAGQAHWAVLVHLRTQRGDYGAKDAQRFIDEVLPAAAGAPVQIAHAGGWGGIDPPTLAALTAFADAMQAHPRRFRHVWFDLSGVWTDKTPEADKRALVALIRRIGLRHFLPGSDWPYTGADLADYDGRVVPQLPLTAAEQAIIRTQVAPYAR